MRIAIDANTILSGLFVRGNERRLLRESLHGAVTLIFAEDVVDEVYDVIEKTFRNAADLRAALELLESVFAAGELRRRKTDAQHLGRWSPHLRDPTDAPVLACAVAAKADGGVSGDKDVLELRDTGGLKVHRTKELLDRLAARTS